MGCRAQILARAVAIHRRCLSFPPIIIDGVRSKGNLSSRNSETFYHCKGSSGRNNHLVGVAKKKWPKRLLERDLPGFPVARGQTVRVGTEQKRRARSLGRASSDPEGCANVANKTQHGVKLFIAYQFRKSGIVQSTKGFFAGAFIGNRYPGIPLQERNIPFYAGGKIRIDRGFRSAQ